MRLIDADALKKAMDGYWGRCQRIRKPRNGETAVFLDVMATVENQPTVDAVPVERDIPKAPTDKQLEEDGYGAWGSLYGRCPNCRESVYEEQNYCEKCGQRLDWSREERTCD